MGTMGEPIRARPEDEQDVEAEALERMRRQIQDIPQASPLQVEPLPTSYPDPEASSATAHTLDGSWDDATADAPARPASPSLDQADAEGEALRRLAAEGRPAPPTPPQAAPPQPLAPSAEPDMVISLEDAEADQYPEPVRPEAMVRPDDSMSLDDDSPDSLHAMAPRRPEPETGGARSLGTPALPPPDEREGFVTDAESAASPPAPGGMEDMDIEPDGDADDPLRALAVDEVGPKPSGPTTGPGTLDEGLPSEADIAGARERDQFLGPLRHLQAGLRGAIGRPHRAMDSDAQPLIDERSRGLRERLAAKGVERRGETEAAQQAVRQASTDSRADRSLQMQQDRLDLAERSLDSTIEGRDRSADRLEGDSARRASIAGAGHETGSDESEGARAGVRASLALLRESGARGQIMAQSIEREFPNLDSMNAVELEQVVRRLQSAGIRGSGGGTGGGAARQRGESARTTLRRLLTESGRPDVVDGLTDAQVQAQLGQEIDRPAGGRPGGSPRGPTAADRAVAATRTSLGAVRHHLDSLGDRRDIPGIGIADGNTPYRALTDEGRLMRNMIRDLSDNYLRMVSGAAVPEHEIEQFAQRLALTDESQFPGTIERMERELEARATGQVQDAESTYRPEGAHAPAPAQAAPPSASAMVTVVGPRGPVRMRRDQLPASLPAGFSIQEGP